MHDVFLSYSQSDKQAADATCHALERNGVRVWMAPRDVTPGREWASAIIEAINGCRVVVLVLTRHSNQSAQVRREIERAVHKGKTIIPIRFDDIVPHPSLEYFISSFHWLDMFPPPVLEKLTTLWTSISLILNTGSEEFANKSEISPQDRPTGSGAVATGRYRDFGTSVSSVLNSSPVIPREKCLRLFHHYLGTAKQPVPFGGRAEMIHALNTWLQSSEGCDRLLITAPAGRGKTSVLVQWLRQISEDWRVVFVPISIRFELSSATDFYQLLAHQLSHATGDPLGATGTISEEYYRDRSIEILAKVAERPLQLVVIIDGLDEANGWRISSTLLSCSTYNVKIVVSARWMASDLQGPVEWARRIEWADVGAPFSSYVPQPLDQQGIAEALVSMGHPVADLGSREEILDELLRLTGGDPLLVRIYADRLWERRPDVERLNPTELRAMDAGYRGFFRHWFEKQAGAWEAGDPEVRDSVLAVLACALGPLFHQDIEQIVMETFGDQAIRIRTVIDPLRRFIVGDGVAAGYAFQHPKFAEYFLTEHFRGEKFVARVDAGLRRWCAGAVAAVNVDDASKRTPQYVFLHYVYHLIQVVYRPELFLPLTSEAWLAASRKFDTSLQNYASQWRAIFEHLSQYAHCPDWPDIRLGLSSVLIMNSLRTSANSVPWSIVCALTLTRQLTLIQFESRLAMMGRRDAIEARVALASSPEFASARNSLLSEAIVQAFEAPSERVKNATIITSRLRKSDPKALFEAVVRGLDAELWNSESSTLSYPRALSDLLGILDPSDDSALIDRIARINFQTGFSLPYLRLLDSRLRVESTEARRNTLEWCVKRLARTILEMDPERIVNCVRWIALRLRDDFDESLFGDLLGCAQALDNYFRPIALAAIACARPGPPDDLIEEAIAYARHIETLVGRGLALFGVASVIGSEVAWMEAAIALVEEGDRLGVSIWGWETEPTKSVAIAELAAHATLQKNERALKHLWKLVDRNAGDPATVKAILRIGDALGGDRRGDARKLAWASAIDSAALEELAHALDFDRDDALIRTIVDEKSRKSLSIVLTLLAREDDFSNDRREPLRRRLLNSALQAIGMEESRESQQKLYERLGRAMTIASDAPFVSQALALCETIGDVYSLVVAAIAVAQMSPVACETGIRSLLASSRSASDPALRARLLTRFLSWISLSERDRLIAEILTAIESIDNANAQEGAFCLCFDSLNDEDIDENLIAIFDKLLTEAEANPLAWRKALGTLVSRLELEEHPEWVERLLALSNMQGSHVGSDLRFAVLARLLVRDKPHTSGLSKVEKHNASSALRAIEIAAATGDGGHYYAYELRRLANLLPATASQLTRARLLDVLLSLSGKDSVGVDALIILISKLPLDELEAVIPQIESFANKTDRRFRDRLRATFALRCSQIGSTIAQSVLVHSLELVEDSYWLGLLWLHLYENGPAAEAAKALDEAIAEAKWLAAEELPLKAVLIAQCLPQRPKAEIAESVLASLNLIRHPSVRSRVAIAAAQCLPGRARSDALLLGLDWLLKSEGSNLKELDSLLRELNIVGDPVIYRMVLEKMTASHCSAGEYIPVILNSPDDQQRSLLNLFVRLLLGMPRTHVYRLLADLTRGHWGEDLRAFAPTLLNIITQSGRMWP